MQQKLFCGLAVEAMAVFRDLRNFVVQREPQTQLLRCYCANADANAQSEWVLSDILLKMFDSTRIDKLYASRWKKEWIPIVKSLHERVWPDFVFPAIRVPKKDREKAKGSREDLVDENTIPTSTMVLAFVVFATHSNRKATLRQKAASYMHFLISRVCSIAGGLQHDRIKVNDKGLVVQDIWKPDDKETIQKLWDVDLLDSSAFWVQSQFDSPHVADIITFSLRDQVPKVKRGSGTWRKWEKIREGIQEIAIIAVRLVTEALHSNLQKMTMSQGLKRKITREEEGNPKKKCGTLKTVEVAQIVGEVVQKLYQNEVPGADHCHHFKTLFFCWVTAVSCPCSC